MFQFIHPLLHSLHINNTRDNLSMAPGHDALKAPSPTINPHPKDYPIFPLTQCLMSTTSRRSHNTRNTRTTHYLTPRLHLRTARRHRNRSSRNLMSNRQVWTAGACSRDTHELNGAVLTVGKADLTCGTCSRDIHRSRGANLTADLACSACHRDIRRLRGAAPARKSASLRCGGCLLNAGVVWSVGSNVGELAGGVLTTT